MAFSRSPSECKNHTEPPVAIIVGSSPSAPFLDENLPREAILIAVNNAWRLNRKFDYLIFPGDFPIDRLPPKGFAASLVSNAEYMPAVDGAGGIIFCGATMAFAAGYWAVEEVRPKLLGYFASDMIYGRTSGTTHFYGQGTPDPLRKDISLGSLEARSVRLFCLALANGTLIVNHSRESESRLVFPRLSIADCDRLLGYDSSHFRSSWHSLLSSARELRRIEASAPFDSLRHDYWTLENDHEAVKFVRELDHRWLQLVPEVALGWDSYWQDMS